jgi:hypothetical protein
MAFPRPLPLPGIGDPGCLDPPFFCGVAGAGTERLRGGCVLREPPGPKPAPVLS